MSHRNLQIKYINEVDKEFLKKFWRLGDYHTPDVVIKKEPERVLEGIVEKIGKKLKADLAVILSTNESYIVDKRGTLNQEVAFYQKTYQH
ncbi:MAG: hypothetical protein M1416_01070 [Candidatus Pacearchaeota archaeon]|nr:hypothetical protein [Candidatus Pacearchaeota archaeon]